jgi:hypothetical protein
MHAGEECCAPSGTAGLSIVVHKHATFLCKPVNVWCFPNHQSAVIAARLHPADVIAHDEQDVGFLVLRLSWSDYAEKRSRGYKERQAIMD